MKEVDCYLCPNCGADVQVGSPSCPGCGPRKVARKMRRKKAERSPRSWEQPSQYDGLDLPDHEFDYEEFVEREFGGRKRRRWNGLKWYWWLTAVTLILVFALFGLRFF